MTPAQLDECRGFLSRLVVELDHGPKALLFMLDAVKKQIEPLIENLKNLRIFSRPFLEANMHHQLRCASDVIFCRAMRDVSSAQLALSRQKVLHTICPARDGYMGELDSAIIADQMGIAKLIRHEKQSIKEVVNEYISDQDSTKVATKAQKVAQEFFMSRGVAYLVELLSG